MTLYRFDQIAENIRVPVMPKPEDSERYIGLEHMDTDSLRIRRWGADVDLIGQKLTMKEGDVLFARRNAYIRRVAVAPFDGIFSAHGMVLRAKPDVCLHEFLPVFMQSDYFMERAIKISVGSLSPTINWTSLIREEFEIPSLNEQRRIADLLWAADDYVTQLSELLEKLEHVRKSFLFEKFNQLMNCKEKLVKVSQAGEVLMGRQLSPKYMKNISPKPYLRVANVFDGYLDLSDVKSMDFNETESQRFLLKFGDVLLNEGQSRELVGRSCIYRDEIPNCCFQNTLLRFRPKLTTSEYAHYFFQYCQYTGRFVAKSKQTTSIAHLGSGRFTEMSFPVPEPSEEKEIVDSLNEINKNIAQLNDTKNKTLIMKAEILKKELLIT